MLEVRAQRQTQRRQSLGRVRADAEGWPGARRLLNLSLLVGFVLLVCPVFCLFAPPLLCCWTLLSAGGIGQPLSLLLKQHPLITQLSVYDISPIIHGVTADLSHCDSPAKIVGHQESLAAALKDADVVVMPAGVPRKPVSQQADSEACGHRFFLSLCFFVLCSLSFLFLFLLFIVVAVQGQTRDDLFNMNAKIVAGCAKEFAKACPNASVLIISNPVNSTVPIFAEVLKRHKVYNKSKVRAAHDAHSAPTLSPFSACCRRLDTRSLRGTSAKTRREPPEISFSVRSFVLCV